MQTKRPSSFSARASKAPEEDWISRGRGSSSGGRKTEEFIRKGVEFRK